MQLPVLDGRRVVCGAFGRRGAQCAEKGLLFSGEMGGGNWSESQTRLRLGILRPRPACGSHPFNRSLDDQFVFFIDRKMGPAWGCVPGRSHFSHCAPSHSWGRSALMYPFSPDPTGRCCFLSPLPPGRSPCPSSRFGPGWCGYTGHRDPPAGRSGSG